MLYTNTNVGCNAFDPATSTFMKDYFSVLFIDETASLDEVKLAYRKLARKFHPDSNSGSDEFVLEFRKIQEAYEKITDYLVDKTTQGFQNYSENKTRSNNTRYKHSSTGSRARDSYQEDSELKEKAKSFNSSVYPNDTQKPIQFYKIGEKLTIGSFEYLALSFDYQKSIGNSIFNSISDGLYLSLVLKITNKSKMSQVLHNYMYRLFDKEKSFYEFSSKGLSTLTMSGVKTIDFFGKEVNPNISIETTLIFEVPDISEYNLTLCGGSYHFNNMNHCICDDIGVVKII